MNDQERRELPEGWRWARLGEVSEAIRGVTFSSGDAKGMPFDEGIACLTTSSVQDKVDWTTARFISEQYVSSPSQIVRVGDILVSTANSKALVGKSCLVFESAIIATFGAFVTVLRSSNKIIPEWLALAMRTTEASNFFFKKSSHTTNISNLRVSDLLDFAIPLPPLPEQRRIAAVLSEHLALVEQARTSLEARLEATQALPVALLREVFESEEAQGWERQRLGELALLGPDNGAFKKRHEFGAGVPFINVSDLYRGIIIDLAQVERVEVSGSEAGRYAVAAGDLFFCRSSLKREGIGWCAYVDEVTEPTIFDCHVMRVRPQPNKLSSKYLAYYWRHPQVRSEVISSSKTATMTTMNQEDLARVEIPLPSILDQQRLVANLAEKIGFLDSGIATAQSQLATLNAMPAALLRKAFNGEL